MAAKRRNGNGSSLIEQAIATLIQNQATLVQNQAAFVQTQAAFVADQHARDREVAAIRRDLDDMRNMINVITQDLAAVRQMIERLPDAVRERVGFR
jgi:hypothetical protein